VDRIAQRVEAEILACQMCRYPTSSPLLTRSVSEPLLGVCRVHAMERAWTLLWHHLTPGQRTTLWHKGGFLVRKPVRGTWYVLTLRSSSGIFRLDMAGQYGVESLCAVLMTPAPLADQVLAQKLWLETAPSTLRRIAHRNHTMQRLPVLIGTVRLDELQTLYPRPALVPEELNVLERRYLELGNAD
jgi:hypothetical protein